MAVKVSAGKFSGLLMTLLCLGLNDSFVLSGLLESAPLEGGYTRNLPFCWLSCFAHVGRPMEGTPINATKEALVGQCTMMPRTYLGVWCHVDWAR
jgi:hypothetical protein